MKISLLVVAATMLFAASAWGQNLTATQIQKKQEQPQKPALIRVPNGEGAVQWMLHLGNPLQGINPFAPAEYGDGTEFIDYYSDYDPSPRIPPGKQTGHGVRLLSFRF